MNQTNEKLLTKEEVLEAINEVNLLFVDERDEEIGLELDKFTSNIYAAWFVEKVENKFGRVARKSFQYWRKFIVENITHPSLKKNIDSELDEYVVFRR